MTEYMPWASGKRKSPPRRKGPSRRRRRKHGLLAILFGVIAAALLVVGLVTESLLYYLAMALMGLASLAQRRAWAMEMRMAQRASGEVIPPKARQQARDRQARPRPTARDEPDREPTEPTAGGTPKCTESGKPIDACECASRHVATADGARRYGLPIGSPMGRRSGKSGTRKPTGTTKRA